MRSGIYIRIEREGKWENVELEDLMAWEIPDILAGRDRKELEAIIYRLLEKDICPVCRIGGLVANEYECSACGELFLLGEDE